MLRHRTVLAAVMKEAGMPTTAEFHHAGFALSQLPGEGGFKALAAALEDRQLSMEICEQALIWLAQSV